MITLDLSILNQKGTPMFNSDIFANRPAAGIAGRIFISTDTLTIYRDTGTTWDTIGGGGGGTIGGTIATGQVAFGTASNTIGGNNNLWWDNASTFLGINTNTPNNNLVVNTIVSDGGILIKQNNTTIGELRRVGTNNYSKLLLINAGVDNIDLNAGGFSYIRQNNFAIGTATDGGQKLQVSGGDVNFSGSTGLNWINTTTRLGIGTNTPVSIVDISSNGGRLTLTQNTAGSIFNGIDFTTTTGVFASIIANQNTGEIRLSAVASYFYTIYSSGSERMRFATTGNVLINTTTDNGARLQISGDVSATGIYSNTYGFNYGAGNTKIFSQLGTTTGTLLTIRSTISYTGTGDQTSCFIENSIFAPTSGSGIYNGLNINASINQTGTAIGITRSLYINPNITLAVDYRSIQWDNNTGWGLFGLGTAASYFAGNVQIGSTTAIGSTIKLQVTGTGALVHTNAYTTGTIQSFVIQRNTTINTTISASSGICNYVSTGDSTIQSSQSVPASTSFAGIYSYNKYVFSAAALTLTATQAAGNGLRSVSQLQTQNVFKGTNSGTITHVSGIQIAGFYNEADTVITPIITNAYQLIINDTGAYGHTFSFTNRWGIYQEGINDRNYLAGNLLLNSTTDTGQILQVNGAIRVNGQASGTAGGNSGQHLIINVDGTQYKINLLNP